MKRYLRAMLGVTLLEILLVLAVAAFVIIMSIRYYESTRAAAGIQDLESVIAAISATADNYALGTGSYDGLTLDAIWTALPKSLRGETANTISTPWGPQTMTFVATAKISYTASITLAGAPPIVCATLSGYITKTMSQHVTTPPTGCSGGSSGGTLSWTYNLAAVG